MWNWNQKQYWTDIETKQNLKSEKKKTLSTELGEALHLRSLFNYNFPSSTYELGVIDSTMKEESKLVDNVKELLTDVVEDYTWEFTKDLIGTALIGIGAALANPLGPEDTVSPTPIDEIVGVGLIWIGRLIRVA